MVSKTNQSVWTRFPIIVKLVRWLALLPGFVIILLIAFMPGLPELTIISAILCIISFTHVAVVSYLTSGEERKKLIEKLEGLKDERLKKIEEDLSKAETRHQLAQASRQTLEIEAKRLQAVATSSDEVTKSDEIKKDLKKVETPHTLAQASRDTLRKEAERLKGITPLKEKSPEDNALIIGIGALFGLINGLGISDALTAYFGLLSENPAFPLQGYLFGMVTLDYSYTFRLIGFFATIIPFIHGFILTLRGKWYYNPLENRYHLSLAFFFFIAIFIHTILFFLLALNLYDISLYLLYLWLIMLVNIGWVIIQSKVTDWKLKRTDTFLTEWKILNFNTIAFLSIFIFAYPQLLEYYNTLGQNLIVNILILLVLVFRTVADYVVGWKKIYNKPDIDGEDVDEKPPDPNTSLFPWLYYFLSFKKL